MRPDADKKFHDLIPQTVQAKHASRHRHLLDNYILDAFLVTADELQRKEKIDDIAGWTALSVLDLCADEYEASHDKDDTKPKLQALYLMLAPRLSFSKDFTRSVATRVGKWAAQLGDDADANIIWPYIANETRKDVLQTESRAFSTIVDPDRLAFNASAKVMSRPQSGNDILIETRDWDDVTPATMLQTLRKADKYSYHSHYKFPDDTILFYQARIKCGTGKATAKLKSQGEQDEFLNLLPHLHKENATDPYAFYDYFGDYYALHYKLGHEKIHQYTAQCYAAFQLDHTTRRKLHFRHNDSMLYRVSQLCYDSSDPELYHANLIEQFPADILQQTPLHNKAIDRLRHA